MAAVGAQSRSVRTACATPHRALLATLKDLVALSPGWYAPLRFLQSLILRPQRCRLKSQSYLMKGSEPCSTIPSRVDFANLIGSPTASISFYSFAWMARMSPSCAPSATKFTSLMMCNRITSPLRKRRWRVVFDSLRKRTLHQRALCIAHMVRAINCVVSVWVSTTTTCSPWVVCVAWAQIGRFAQSASAIAAAHTGVCCASPDRLPKLTERKGEVLN